MRVLAGGQADASLLAAGVDRCVALGADVVNLSTVGLRPRLQSTIDALRAAVSRARDANRDVVMAAGNMPGLVMWPGSTTSDLAVVVDARDGAARCSFASTGPGCSWAHGCPWWLPMLDGGGWTPQEGSSFAAPVVAAALAAMHAYAPGLDAAGRRAALANTPDGVLDEPELLRRIGRGDLVSAAPALPAPRTADATTDAAPGATTPTPQGEGSAEAAGPAAHRVAPRPAPGRGARRERPGARVRRPPRLPARSLEPADTVDRAAGRGAAEGRRAVRVQDAAGTTLASRRLRTPRWLFGWPER